MNIAMMDSGMDPEKSRRLVCAGTMGRMVERTGDTILEWRKIGLIRGYKRGRVVLFDPLEVVEDLKNGRPPEGCAGKSAEERKPEPKPERKTEPKQEKKTGEKGDGKQKEKSETDGKGKDKGKGKGK